MMSAENRWSTFLFLAVFLFFWITMDPFVDLVQRQAAAGRGAPITSNALNQIVALTLTGLLFAWGFRSRMRAALLQPRVLISILFLWFLLASSLSPHPADAVKRTILAAMTVINASVFLILPRCERHFVRLLLAGCLIMLGFAYFGVIFLPLRAIHQAGEIAEPFHAGYWRGQYTHKNVAAAVMLVAVFFGLYIRSSGFPKAGLLVAVLATFFLLHTGGKSSTAMLPAILVLAFIFERWRFSRFPIAVGGIALFNLVALGSAFSKPFHDLIKSLGVDPTFTNRTDIWQLAAEAIARSPVLGYGFQGFWQTPELADSPGKLETWAVLAFNGHNAYVDLVVTTGFPGLVLTLVWMMFLPLSYAGQAEATGNAPALTRMFTRIWLYGLYAGCLESVFFQSGSPVWFAMLFSVFGLRMQGRSRLRAPAPVPPEAVHA